MSTLVPIIGKAAATIGIQVAKKGVEYASKAYSGHTGIAVLNGIVNGSKKSGENVAGKIGGMVGSILGKAAAGHAVPVISSQVKAIGETLQNAGYEIIDIATQKDEGKDKTEEKPSKTLSTALQVTKIAATVVGTAAVAAGIAPVCGIGVTYAIADALPKIINAAMKETDEEKQQDLGDILSSAAKKVCIESAGVLIGNVVRFDQIKGAYNARVAQGELAGKTVGSYLPGFMRGAAEKAGKLFGTVDAGRYAMSPEVLQKANDASEAAEQIVKGGLKLTDAVVSSKCKKQESTALGTMKKVAWISAGVAGGIALAAIAPEVAPVIAATSLLSVSDQIVSWAKGKFYAKEKAIEAPVEEQKAADEKPLDQEIAALKEELISKVAVDAESLNLPIAAPAA